MNVRVMRDPPAAPSEPRAATSRAQRGNRRLEPRAATEPSRGSVPPTRRSLRERAAARASAMVARLRGFFVAALGPLRVLLRVAVALGLVAASVAVYRFVDRYARTSPEFAIETLSIAGAERVERAELEEAMGVTVGDNVFQRSPEEIRAGLEAHPWIASATVRRRLPRTVEVEVRERVPALLLVLESPHLVDEDATVFKALEPGDPVDLPVVTGVDVTRFRGELGYRTELLTSAIALLREWQSATLARRDPIAEIHVEPDESLTLFVGDDGTEIRLGRGPYRSKLARLRRVLDELSRRQSRPLYVYLDNVRRPERVTVRVR